MTSAPWSSRAVIAAIVLLLTPCPAVAANTHIPYHVETWAGYRYAGINEGIRSSGSTMRKWVTYLDGAWPYTRAVCDVDGHPCRTVDYINTSNEYFGTCGWSAAVVAGVLTQQHTLAESAWVHVGPPLTYVNRIFNNLYSHCVAATENTGLFINKKSISGHGNALAFFNAFMLKEYGKHWPDYLMNDDVSVVNDFWPTGLSAYEFSSWVDLQNAQAAFLGGEVTNTGKAQNLFFNGCSSNPATVTGVSLIKMRPNIVGCISENNVTSDNLRRGRVPYALDNCARVTLNRNGGIYVNGPDGDGGMLARRQATAFNMLCYAPGREVFWEEEEWGGKYVNVFPEEGIYPARPLQSMRTPSDCPDETIPRSGPGRGASTSDACTRNGHNDLLVGDPNVERREFAACYNRGAAIGHCAVIWNLNDQSVGVNTSWLLQRYAHIMRMNGGTIDEGGSITLTPFKVTQFTVPPYDAVFLFQ
jgi:hypothetical protein